jgi:hypothetical protein
MNKALDASHSPFAGLQEEIDQMTKGMTANDVRMAIWLATPASKRKSREGLAEEMEIGVPTTYWYAVKESVSKLRHLLVKALFSGDLVDVVQAVKEKALQGDIPAASLFLRWASDALTESGGSTNIYGNVSISLTQSEVERKLAALRANAVEVRPDSGANGVPVLSSSDMEPDADGGVQ